MKNLLSIALIVPLTLNVVATQADGRSLLALAKDKQMFATLNTYLNFTKIERVTGAQNVEIYMTRFKDNPHKIYAISSLGNEILYSADMKNEKNGSIGLMKNGEAIVIEFKNGNKVIRDITRGQFQSRYATEYHGGTGFCQRENGESFGTCYRAESDQFCDSFVSCVALATQPSVAILIAIACSCNA
jgi:ribosomal protein L21E